MGHFKEIGKNFLPLQKKPHYILMPKCLKISMRLIMFTLNKGFFFALNLIKFLQILPEVFLQYMFIVDTNKYGFKARDSANLTMVLGFLHLDPTTACLSSSPLTTYLTVPDCFPTDHAATSAMFMPPPSPPRQINCDLHTLF